MLQELKLHLRFTAESMTNLIKIFHEEMICAEKAADRVGEEKRNEKKYKWHPAYPELVALLEENEYKSKFLDSRITRERFIEFGRCQHPELSFNELKAIAMGEYSLFDTANGIVLIHESKFAVLEKLKKANSSSPDSEIVPEPSISDSEVVIESTSIPDPKTDFHGYYKYIHEHPEWNEKDYQASGWLSPDGRYFCCAYEEHEWLAGFIISKEISPSSIEAAEKRNAKMDENINQKENFHYHNLDPADVEILRNLNWIEVQNGNLHPWFFYFRCKFTRQQIKTIEKLRFMVGDSPFKCDNQEFNSFAEFFEYAENNGYIKDE